MYYYNLRFDKRNARFLPNHISSAQKMFSIGAGRAAHFYVKEVYLKGLCNIAEEDEEAAQVLNDVFSLFRGEKINLWSSAACPSVCLMKKFKSHVLYLFLCILEAIANPYVSDGEIILMNPDDQPFGVYLMEAFVFNRPLLFENIFERYEKEWLLFLLSEASERVFTILQEGSRKLKAQNSDILKKIDASTTLHASILARNPFYSFYVLRIYDRFWTIFLTFILKS